MDQVQAFRRQAQACAELGSPMYAALVGRLADDLAAGGVTRDVLAGHESDPGPSALALRLVGSVHRLVLERRAGELATYYPSVGGTWEPEGGWRAFESLLRDRPDEVRARLARPPQTNEVGRAAALMGGLLTAGESVRLPVRLFEMGSSAGLNLLVDRFGYTDAEDRVFGEETSALVLRHAWRGRPRRPWGDLTVVERLGCDPAPVDAQSTEGRLTLTSYVWPDQTVRHERLRLALQVAARHPVQVVGSDAGSFVEGLELADGALTVLWHSVMWQYLDRPEQEAVRARVDALGAAARPQAPFCHLFLEPTRRTPDSAHEFLVALELWDGDRHRGERRILGTAPGHGVPVDWE